MKRKTFVICDREANYVGRFCRYLERREDCLLAVRGFTGAEALTNYLSENRPDILLLDETLAGEELWRLAGERCRACLLLTEAPEEGEERAAVYRYQSAERILRRALVCYEERVAAPGQENRSQAELYGVYSPVKRCYKTTFALILGQLLAERGPTLYLNFEDCAGIADFRKEDGGENLSDVLYYHRVGASGVLRLYGAVQSLGKLSFIPPVLCPQDIREAEPEALAELTRAISFREEYTFLVLDLGDALRDPMPLLRLCKRIFLPLRADAVSRTRVEAFVGGLKENGEEELLPRIHRLALPGDPELKKGAVDYPELAISRFGRYVEKKLQSEGML